MRTILKIYPDMDPESPREWSNLGTMACWHRRYNLGDEQPDESPIDYMEYLIAEKDNGELNDRLEEEESDYFDEHHADEERSSMEQIDHWDNYRDAQVLEAFDRYYIWLPLYLYDHSGISISTGSFSCPWDSGQVGFIYVARDRLDGELPLANHYPLLQYEGTPEEKLYQTRDEHAIGILNAETNSYDFYLRGCCYGFVLEEDGEEVDSCWGFLGEDWRESGITDHVDLDEVDEVWFMQPVNISTYEPVEKEILNEREHA